MSVMMKLIRGSAIALCRFRGRGLVDGLARACDAFHRGLNNVDFNMQRNGELRVLQVIAGFGPKVVFDIGANEGEWCRLMAGLSPSAAIHAFEILPSTFDKLTKNTMALDQVKRVNYGLSDEEGTVTINIGRETETSTAFKVPGMRSHDDYYKSTVECCVRKASSYIRENSVEHIDFVKIDVEGMDFSVIRGFEDCLDRVDVVQFEYGVFNIGSHALLADICHYFESRGFAVGKVWPKRVTFFEYDYQMENFHGSNFVAVKKSKPEIMAALKG